MLRLRDGQFQYTRLNSGFYAGTEDHNHHEIRGDVDVPLEHAGKYDRRDQGSKNKYEYVLEPIDDILPDGELVIDTDRKGRDRDITFFIRH
jgi:hypothetical protein